MRQLLSIVVYGFLILPLDWECSILNFPLNFGIFVICSFQTEREIETVGPVCFIKKNRQRVVGSDKYYLVIKKFSVSDIISSLKLIDKIFVTFEARVFQQTQREPAVSFSCLLFFFIRLILTSINPTFRYIDVLSLNNSKCGE